jgi:hypothetical protein
MARISREDYQALEAKIQREIKKIFLEFLKDLEKNTAGSDEAAPAPDQPGPGLLSGSVPGGVPPVPARANRARPSKKAIEVSRLLQGTSADKRSPKKSLEDDMAKIFRKKSRRRSP